MEDQGNDFPIIYQDFVTRAMGKKGLRKDDLSEIWHLATSMVMGRGERGAFEMYLALNEELLTRWRGEGELPVHGAWHHAMVAGILLRALQNCGNVIGDEHVREAMARGGMLPGGVCGFHGICGAATALGAALSVITGATPLEPGTRSEVMSEVSLVNRTIAERGGPRCCPRATYVTIERWQEIAVSKGYALVIEELGNRCPFHDRNHECIKADCWYHPDHGRG